MVIPLPARPAPGVTMVVVADGEATWLPYTLRSIKAQIGVLATRIVVVTAAGATVRAVDASENITCVAVRADAVRARALEEARGADTPFVGLTCGTDYWHGPEKLARQVTSLVANPEAAASFHPVIMRWTDDIRVFPSPEWRRPGTVDAEDVLRAVPWTSLVARTDALQDAAPADAACDFFGLRTLVGVAGLAFDQRPMAVRQMTMLRSPLPGSPLERLETTHATKLQHRQPDDHRLLGSAETFVQDWLAAIESGLVLPAEIGAAEWASRELAGELHQERVAHARTSADLCAAQQQIAEMAAARAPAAPDRQMTTDSWDQRPAEWLRRLARRRRGPR